MTLSLHRRLLLGASAGLMAFLGLTGTALDQAFRDSIDNGLRERLQTRVYALLSAAELAADGSLRMAADLPEPRFATPASGLYAQISGERGVGVWQSGSMLGLPLAFPVATAVGRPLFDKLQAADQTLLAISFTVEWEDARGNARPYTFSVAEDLRSSQSEITGFRRTLWGWLGASALLLIAVQGAILRWSLRPLRRVGDELGEIEREQRQLLGSDYPVELAPLTEGINRFISQEQSRLDHYRRGLGDLAHSLKTPLAVLRGGLDSAAARRQLPIDALEQIDRMSQIVEYQLQRAATAGRRPLAAPARLAAVADRVVGSLRKVYRDKAIDCEVVVDRECRYRAEEGDLFELVGNLADNAFKWSRSRVRMAFVNGGEARSPALRIRIEDDGPGFAPDQAGKLALRGHRADSATPGHGLGLAMVNDIVSAYAGSIELGRSGLGGALVEVRLPG